MLAAYLLAFGAGFLSLSLEVLWVRLFGFANHSLPQAFAFVLTFYLIGIALGALLGKKYCSYPNLWKVSANVLLLSGLMAILTPWLYVEMAFSHFQIMIGGLCILITAALTAILFPIAHHLGVPADRVKVGFAISKVYVANIIGATLGPIVTGLLLLDIFSTQSCFVICAGMAFSMSLICCIRETKSLTWIIGSAGFFILLSFGLAQAPNQLIAKVVEPISQIRRIIENRHGIVTIYDGGKEGDIVFGANVYDGRTNLDPVMNSNHINRLIILSALQRNPERVLMVGLSIGTWLKIISSFPHVKHIDVVEINPGYLEAMKNYPRQYSALSDPRVQLYIDDGRRWLRTHPEQQYDLIIMNTTYYWRVYSSNLLSKEFLSLVKQHMRPHAVFSYNATESPDVLNTAAHVFPYAFLYENFVIAADYDWRKQLKDPASEKILANLSLDGKLLFPKNNQKLIRTYLHEPIISLDIVQRVYQKIVGRQLEIVTDHNLITEYKYGKSLN